MWSTSISEQESLLQVDLDLPVGIETCWRGLALTCVGIGSRLCGDWATFIFIFTYTVTYTYKKVADVISEHSDLENHLARKLIEISLRNLKDIYRLDKGLTLKQF